MTATKLIECSAIIRAANEKVDWKCHSKGNFLQTNVKNRKIDFRVCEIWEAVNVRTCKANQNVWNYTWTSYRLVKFKDY